jgi:hypothetical protein
MMFNHRLGAVLTIALCFLVVGMPSFLASSTALSTVISTNISSDSYNASYPNVQNVGNNVYVVWSEGSHGIWFKSSSNGGSSWSSSLRLSVLGGVAQFPLMTANGSNVYVVWSQTTSVNGTLQIYFTASTNNGLTFSTAKIVDNSPNATDITPVLASFGNDVYVAYDGNGSSYVTSSDNAGATFSTPFQYGSGPEPQLAAWGSTAYAVSDTFNRDALPVWVTTDGGAKWTRTSSNGGISAEPWVMASGTNAIVAWETKTNQSDVWVTSTTNSGKTWTKNYLLSSTVPDAWAPMLGIVGNTEYVAFRSNPGSDASQEYVSVSTNAGATWSAPVAIGFTGRDNSWPTQVSVSGTNAYVMWYERTGTSASSTWNAVIQETSNSGTSWLASPLTLGQSLPESDVATAAVSINNATFFSVWSNATSLGRDQVYFATG